MHATNNLARNRRHECVVDWFHALCSLVALVMGQGLGARSWLAFVDLGAKPSTHCSDQFAPVFPRQNGTANQGHGACTFCAICPVLDRPCMVVACPLGQSVNPFEMGGLRQSHGAVSPSRAQDCVCAPFCRLGRRRLGADFESKQASVFYFCAAAQQSHGRMGQ